MSADPDHAFLRHVVAMPRRMHGAPMKGESSARADITAGRVGPEQAPAKPEYEFD